ncbi:MAG TPA: AEC family transporter [Halothiobacillaceae bacterium]|nr:AEC family transporter [Halothiobacillaceae bacterium]
MVSVILQILATIAIGQIWRHKPLGGVDADAARGVLTTSVYYLFLPALVLAILWRAPLGVDSFRIIATSAVGILSSMLVIYVLAKRMQLTRPQFGALILAASFPNASYMGLPLLGSLFGDEGRAVAIQYDLLAGTPILLSIGVLVAAAYGTRGEAGHPLLALLKVPPLWAALAGVGLNLTGVPAPDGLMAMLERLGAAVVPIMLIALGMSLRLSTLKPAALLRVSPAIAVQLLWMPLAAFGFATLVATGGNVYVAVVLAAATPTMLLGLVLCDRFGLDTGLYATTATATTVLSLLTIPLWHGLVS